MDETMGKILSWAHQVSSQAIWKESYSLSNCMELLIHLLCCFAKFKDNELANRQLEGVIAISPIFQHIRLAQISKFRVTKLVSSPSDTTYKYKFGLADGHG